MSIVISLLAQFFYCQLKINAFLSNIKRKKYIFVPNTKKRRFEHRIIHDK